MQKDDGRVPLAPGSRASTEPVCAVSAASGFDPSRGHSYGSRTSRDRARILAALSQAIDAYAEIVSCAVEPAARDQSLLSALLDEFARLSGWIAQYARFELKAAAFRSARGIRDSDASLAEDPKGLSGEAVAARAESIAERTSHAE